MRDLSKFESNNKEFLLKKRIPFVLVCMTENILKHSIFDAKVDMRTFLKSMGIHDFSTQAFGQDEKVIIKTHILTFMRQIETKTSLYRSETRGDERMWFGSAILPLTESGNLYAVSCSKGELYIM